MRGVIIGIRIVWWWGGGRLARNYSRVAGGEGGGWGGRVGWGGAEERVELLFYGAKSAD